MWRAYPFGEKALEQNASLRKELRLVRETYGDTINNLSNQIKLLESTRELLTEGLDRKDTELTEKDKQIVSLRKLIEIRDAEIERLKNNVFTIKDDHIESELVVCGDSPQVLPEESRKRGWSLW